jgi:hypothetical protein
MLSQAELCQVSTPCSSKACPAGVGGTGRFLVLAAALAAAVISPFSPDVRVLKRNQHWCFQQIFMFK